VLIEMCVLFVSKNYSRYQRQIATHTNIKAECAAIFTAERLKAKQKAHFQSYKEYLMAGTLLMR
jgi:hypothetical protein